MNITSEYGTIHVARGSALCPVCGKRMYPRLYPDTSGKNIPLYCKICKRGVKVNIECQRQSASAH